MEHAGYSQGQIEKEDLRFQQKFMQMAIDLSIRNQEDGGGPFGAVIVREGELIASGANRVVPSCDPTAHAEVTAIRNAARRLKSFDLSGCELYTSCEPCPMCLGAIYWARIDRIYYGNTKEDAKRIGFDDSFIYDEFAHDVSQRKLTASQTMRDEAFEAFDKWEHNANKVCY